MVIHLNWSNVVATAKSVVTSSQKVVNRWNMLDQDTVSAKSVNDFKSKLESERKRNMGLFLGLFLVCWASWPFSISGAAGPVNYL